MTIKDIAKMAGVSPMTVSRVINGHKNVKPETQQRVQSLVDSLGYSPNATAKALVSKRTNSVTLVPLYDITSYALAFMPTVLIGIHSILGPKGYSVKVAISNTVDQYGKVNPDSLSNIDNTDGLFILGIGSDAESAYIAGKSRLPHVLINQGAGGLDLNSVVSDDRQGVYDVVSHLIAKGHTRIGYIRGIPGSRADDTRYQGYLDALVENGLLPDNRYQQPGGITGMAGYHAMNRLLDTVPELTAVAVSCDITALGAMRAIKERGLSIPGDMAVSGFDDADIAMVSDPPLTTVSKDLRRMGEEAARIMLDILEEQHTQVRQIVIPARMVVRQST